MPFIYATALPVFATATAEARLRALCARWESVARPRLATGQLGHCRDFVPWGEALRACASRLLARLLALRALPEGALLDMDAEGRPLIRGAAGWRVAFSHSGRAAFCLVCAPGEANLSARGMPALDAEAWPSPAPTDRAFTVPAPSPAASLRRWVLAEALFKALGAPPSLWNEVAAIAHAHASERSGAWERGNPRLFWHVLAAPGHVLCVALPLQSPTPLRLHWLPWQSLA